MVQKTTTKEITREEFELIRQKYEDAVQARANAIKTMRDDLGWTFDTIAKHFGVSRQAAQKTYQGIKEIEKENGKAQ